MGSEFNGGIDQPFQRKAAVLVVGLQQAGYRARNTHSQMPARAQARPHQIGKRIDVHRLGCSGGRSLTIIEARS